MGRNNIVDSVSSTKYNQDNIQGFLVLGFASVSLMAGWFSPRLISIYGETVSASAILFFPSIVILTLIQYWYGFYAAKQAVYMGSVFVIFSSLYGQIARLLPDIRDPSPINHSFEIFIKQAFALSGPLTVSYITSAVLVLWILAKIQLYHSFTKNILRYLITVVISECIYIYMFSFVYNYV